MTTMSPHYTDEWVTLYGGDALTVLAALPAASVDAVLTDPPYSSGGLYKGDRAMSTTDKYTQTGYGGANLEGFSGDNRDQRSFLTWMNLWLGEARRVLAPGGIVGLFTDWRQLPSMTDALQVGGYVWRGIVPWYKPIARPQMGRFTASCEYLIWGSNGALPTARGVPPLPGFYEGSAPQQRDHQTQKPLDVMRSLVRIVPPGGVILDPFMGSGTTGCAAVLEGRRFVGSELMPHYLDVSERRIRTALGQALATIEDQDALFGGES